MLPYYAQLLDSASAIAASFEQSTGDGDRASLEQPTGDGDCASLEHSTGDGSPPQNGHVTIATTSFAHASQTRALQHGSSSASSRKGSWQTPHAGGGIVALVTIAGLSHWFHWFWQQCELRFSTRMTRY